SSKIFAAHEFGYRRITVERPLRMSYQFSDERIEELRYDPGALNAAMKWVYAEYGQNWSDNADCDLYGSLSQHEEAIRKHVKKHFEGLKEKQLKDLLSQQTWLDQKAVMLKAWQLQKALGKAQFDNMNGYEDALKETGIKLDAKEKKQITNAVSWKNPQAEKVIKKIHTTRQTGSITSHSREGGNPKIKANPIYGLFSVNGKIVEYEPDSDLRDYENIALDPTRPVNEVNEAYFTREVLPHVPEAWIDADKKDAKDQEIGIVGYEIPFNRHFYVYQPPRDLVEIDADLDKVSTEIMELLREVHS
ncbi:MAG: hypothetical protein ACD_39C01021G0003, partial [uncultured bacterium]